MQTISSVRPSPIAGTWYEGDPKALARSIDGYMDAAVLPDLPGEVIALIAPHAGHRYSGAVAGYAFAALRACVQERGSAFDLAAVIAPMHHPYREALITSAHAAYETPLGNIPVDRQALEELDQMLKASLGLGLTAAAYDPEHSLEIELPFLQRVLGEGFQLLPVMVRAQEPRVSQALGHALADVIRGKKAVIVASTDLSHFHDQQTALRLDGAMLEQVEAFSPEGIFQAERSGKGFACGHAALAAVLWAARDLGADTVKVLKRATSGDVTGDYAGVVGYASAVVLKTGL